MGLLMWQRRFSDLTEACGTYVPMRKLKPKHLMHPISSIKGTYSWSTYLHFSPGGWDCTGTSTEDCSDTCQGCEYHKYSKPYKPRVIHFIAGRASLVTWIIAKAITCFSQGHRAQDCSSAGPESGNMDHECVRCGKYWHVPLY